MYLWDIYPSPSPTSWLWRNSPQTTKLCAGLGQQAGRVPPDSTLPTHLTFRISSHGPSSFHILVYSHLILEYMECDHNSRPAHWFRRSYRHGVPGKVPGLQPQSWPQTQMWNSLSPPPATCLLKLSFLTRMDWRRSDSFIMEERTSPHTSTLPLKMF